MVAPGTQFQMTGLPNPANFENLLNQRRGGWMKYLSPEDQQLIASTLGRG